VIWLTWRQQRLETLITGALLVVLATLFIPAGIHVADLFTQQHLAACVDRQTTPCSYAVGNFANEAGSVRSLLEGGWLNLIPGLIGVALAAPLLLDLENGTTRLSWTQSITRVRWLGTKGGFAVATALLAGAGYGLLFTWYDRPFDRIWGPWDEFGFEGIVPIAYILFAFGLALAIGVLVRRSAAALVVGFGAYVAGRLFVQSWLRQRFATPLSVRSARPNLMRDWVVAVRFPHGHNPFLNQACGQAHPAQALVPKGGPRLATGCITRLYQPASRFWEFQGIEFALFAGVALLLLAFATWRVLQAD
jgi:hypothetical protein